MAGAGQTGVELDRMVAVMATWADRHAEVGSGYLVAGRLVLTAGHCIRDRKSGKLAAQIQVMRARDGATVPGGNVIMCPELGVAVIALGDDAPWEAELPGVVFARVDRSRAGMLEDCQTIGFPLFQRDSEGRATSEVHGTLYQRSFSGSTSGTRGAHRLNASDSSSTVASGMACTGCAPVASLNAAYAPSLPTRARPTRSPGSKSRVRAERAMRSFMVSLVLC
jgi:hypothetical protein